MSRSQAHTHFHLRPSCRPPAFCLLIKHLFLRGTHDVLRSHTGNYSRLVCEIQFARSMGYYLIQIYIPASLIVIISWVSFWLHRNATPARVALGVTTVLTMTTLMSSTNAALPKISYVKSIDVYLGTCFVLVFASLLEYAAVGYLGKRIAMRRARLIQLARMADMHRIRCAAAAAAAASLDPRTSGQPAVLTRQPTSTSIMMMAGDPEKKRNNSDNSLAPILVPPPAFQPSSSSSCSSCSSSSSSSCSSPRRRKSPSTSPPPRPPPPILSPTTGTRLLLRRSASDKRNTSRQQKQVIFCRPFLCIPSSFFLR